MISVKLDTILLTSTFRTLSNFVAVKDTLPALTGVRFQRMPDGSITLTASNLDVGARMTIPGDFGTDPIDTILPANQFTDLLKKINSPQVTLEIDTSTITVRHGKRSHVKLPALTGHPYPDLPFEISGTSIHLNAAHLSTAIMQVFPAADKGDGRPELSGIRLQLTDKHDLELIATDALRLAYRRIQTESVLGSMVPIMIPLQGARALAEISSLYEDQGLMVTVAENLIGVAPIGREERFFIGMFEGRIPDAARLMPTLLPWRYNAPKSELFAVLAQAAVVADKDQHTKVTVTLEEKSLLIKTTSDRGLADIVLESATVQGTPRPISFNAKHLLDAIRNIDSETVEIHCSDVDSPAIVRPAGNDSFMTITMPVIDNTEQHTQSA